MSQMPLLSAEPPRAEGSLPLDWLAPPEPPDQSADQPAARQAAAGPILVIDDDESIRRLVVDFLTDEGFPVVAAADGEAALAIMDRVRPAVILLDMRMPILNGWGFAEALRQRGLSIPVVVMTAAQNARRWAEEIAAAGYVAKPFELGQLLETIEKWYPTQAN